MYEVDEISAGKKNCELEPEEKKVKAWSSHQETDLCRQGQDANVNLSTNINSLLNSETV